MTFLHGEAVHAPYGPKQTWSIPSIPYRDNAVSNTALPTTAPAAGSAQAIYTVQSGDLPALPAGWQATWIAAVQLGGVNSDGVSRTVTAQCFKNGSFVANNNPGAVAAAAVWSAQYCVIDVAVGDVIALAAAAASSVACNWNESVFQVWPSRIRPIGSGPWLAAQFSFDTLAVLGTVTTTGVTNNDPGTTFDYRYPGFASSTAPTSPPAWVIDGTNGLGKLHTGDTSEPLSSNTAQRFTNYHGPTQWSGRLMKVRIPQ